LGYFVEREERVLGAIRHGVSSSHSVVSVLSSLSSSGLTSSSPSLPALSVRAPVEVEHFEPRDPTW
jgi:hypothetical protein